MEHNKVILAEADECARLGDVVGMYRVLRKIPLADYSMLHLHPPIKFPALAKALPKLPSDDVQKNGLATPECPSCLGVVVY